MKTMKGPGLFLAQFAGDSRTVQFPRRHLPLGRISRLQGRSDPDLGRAAVRLAESRRVRRLLRRHHGDGAASRPRITELSTHLQGQFVAVHPAFDEAFDGFAAPEVRGNPKARQEWAVEQLLLAAKASRRLGLKRTCDFLRRSRLALHVSVAATPGGSGRNCFRGTGTSLAADPRRIRRGRMRRLLRDTSRRGSSRWSHIRAVRRCRRRPRARVHQLRSEPLSAATTRLSRLYRSLSRAHQGVPRQGRGVQSHAGGSASMAVMRTGSTAPAASARSATDKSISARSSPSSHNTITIPGPCSNGNAA